MPKCKAEIIHSGEGGLREAMVPWGQDALRKEHHVPLAASMELYQHSQIPVQKLSTAATALRVSLSDAAQ